MIESQEHCERVEDSKTIGQKIIDLLVGRDVDFAKATLTLCLATVLRKSESMEERLVNISKITHMLKRSCQTPTIH